MERSRTSGGMKTITAIGILQPGTNKISGLFRASSEGVIKEGENNA